MKRLNAIQYIVLIISILLLLVDIVTNISLKIRVSTSISAIIMIFVVFLSKKNQIKKQRKNE